jgi:trimeric autotransporter adhesin
MKKLLVIFLLCILHCSVSYAQRWDSLQRGLLNVNDMSYLGVNALCVYNGNLYAGGSLIYVGNSGCIASWNGTSWDSLGYGVVNDYFPCGSCCTNGPNVSALTTYNGSLFVGGFFDYIQSGYANAVAQWNGLNWDSVADGVQGASHLAGTDCSDVESFAIYKGDLYMGGIFQYTGNNLRVNKISRWNGTIWSTVGSGMNVNGGVSCLAVYNGNLYAGGSFDSAGGIPAKNIAMWNGTQWAAVGSGINSYGVTALCVYNNVLYAGGSFDSAGGHKANNIAEWNGSAWSPVGAGVLPVNSSNGVFALTVYGPDLCVGGQFNNAGGASVNNIALWNGTSWSAVGSGVNGNINALTTYNGSLIAGGVFDTAGGVPANNIAQWISPLGINGLSDVSGEVKIYPNPNNGQFTIAAKNEELRGKNSVEIYNVLGEKVYSATLEQVQGDNSIDISNQPAGVYLYRVLNIDGGLAGEGKLVIAK